MSIINSKHIHRNIYEKVDICYLNVLENDTRRARQYQLGKEDNKI